MRETGTGQQVAQLHERLMMMIMIMILMPLNVAVCLKLLKYFIQIHRNETKRSAG